MRFLLKICLAFWLLILPLGVIAQDQDDGSNAQVAQDVETLQQEQNADFLRQLAVWDRTSEQTEVLLANPDATNEQLSNFRKALDINRNAATAYVNKTEPELNDLEQQLEALTPAEPSGSSKSATAQEDKAVDEEIPESNELKERKKALEARVAEVQGNVLSANQIIKEANGLIDQIDTRMRQNYYTAILTRTKSPLSFDSIQLSWYSTKEIFRTFGSEVKTNFEAIKGTNLISERWVTAFLFILLGSGVIYIFPKLAWLELARKTPWPTRMRRILMPLAPTFVALVALPVGVELIESGLAFTGLFDSQGAIVLNSIKQILYFLFAARWLKWLIYQVDGHESVTRYKFSGITYVLAFTMGLSWVLPDLMRISGVNVEAASTTNFLIILTGTVCVWYFTSRKNYSLLFGIKKLKTYPKLKRFLSLIIRYSMVVTLLLCLIGYFAASYQFFRGITVSSYIIFLGIHLAHFLTHWIANVLNEFDLAEEDTTHRELEDRLWPILIQIGIWAISIPAVLVAWGVPHSTILELWSRLKQGVSLGDFRISMTEIFKFILVFYIGYLLIKALKKAMDRSVLTRTNLDLGARAAVVSLIGYVGYTIVALVAMSVAGIDLSAIGYIAGALSVGIGFGLQNIVQNFISGLILLVERPVKKGDWIKVGDSEGYVQNIAVRSTAIRTFDDSTIIVPNADLISSPVTNWFHDDQSARVTVYVGVAYDSDPEHVTDVLLDLVNQSSYRRRDPNSSVIIRELADSSIHFELRFWINDADWITRARSEIYFAILDRFKKEGIQIPFPQRDINIINGTTPK